MYESPQKQAPTFYEKDEFADIPEFKQYEGKFPLLTPTYDKKYIVPFEKLKTLIKNGYYSARTNRLANKVITELPSNYNAWEAKRRCIDGGVSSIYYELAITAEVLEDTIKNFQGWEFRRYLIQLRGDPTGEVEFLEKILEDDHKNYHLWTYRVWLCETFKLYRQELPLAYRWIERDVMNNTAWTYRFFLLKHLQLSEYQFQAEVDYIFRKIQLSLDNEASWNYLRGWFPSIQLKRIPCKKYYVYSKEYCKYPTILERVLAIIPTNPNLIQTYTTLVHIYSQNEKELARGICELLAQRQKQKSNYWRWVATNL